MCAGRGPRLNRNSFSLGAFREALGSRRHDDEGRRVESSGALILRMYSTLQKQKSVRTEWLRIASGCISTNEIDDIPCQWDAEVAPPASV